MERITSVTLLAVSLLLSSANLVLAGSTQSTSRTKLSAEYNHMVERIDAVRASGDSNKMKELAQLIQDQWHDDSVVQYSTLVDKICYAILSSSIGKEDDGTATVEKYSLLALANKDSLPVLTEADLVGYLQPQEHKALLKNTLSQKDWADYRDARASIALHLLGRISTEIDPHFDFSRVPMLNVAPPLAAPVDSGASPQDVADPKLRAEYEASIRANEAFNSKRNEQLQLKELNETLVPLQQKYVVDLYSVAPYNLSELNNLLSKYQLADTAKQKIIDQVTVNMASGNHS